MATNLGHMTQFQIDKANRHLQTELPVALYLNGERMKNGLSVIVLYALSDARRADAHEFGAASLRQQDASIRTSLREGGGHIGMDAWGNRSAEYSRSLGAAAQAAARSELPALGVPLEYHFDSKEALASFRAEHKPIVVSVVLD